MVKFNAVVYRNSLQRENDEGGRKVTVIDITFSTSVVTLLYVDEDGIAGTAQAHDCRIILEPGATGQPVDLSTQEKIEQLGVDLAKALSDNEQLVEDNQKLANEASNLDKLLKERDKKLEELVDVATPAKAKVVKPAKAK